MSGRGAAVSRRLLDPDHFDSDPQYFDLEEPDQIMGTTVRSDSPPNWIGEGQTEWDQIVHQLLGTQQDSKGHPSGLIWNSGERGAETGGLASTAVW
ncbi:unnamed protein product [Caretta caretta]